MKKIAVFSVGSGGHVLPAKNIINELIDHGVSIDRFIFILVSITDGKYFHLKSCF